MRLIVDDQPIEGHDGDTVLDAVVRSGAVPQGALCTGGDCANCLANIDGVAYVRMCQTPARPGTRVSPFAVDDHPPLPGPSSRPYVPHRFEHVDVVVAGGGESGRSEAARLVSEGRSVAVIDAAAGDEVLGLYPGPEVIARRDGEIVSLSCSEVVVATGASEIQPIVPGSRLAGILTPSAVRRFADRSIDLGRLVTVGFSPEHVDHTRLDGRLVRFEGTDRVRAVVVEQDGRERHVDCDTVAVDLGTYPRDLLARMGGDQPVRVVGDASGDPTIPSCPEAGVVCPCSGVAVDDLDFVWERGFRELELIKRATLAGTGTCQGRVCTPYLRSFVQQRGGALQPTFTSRPPIRQLTLGEAAAGHHLPAIHRTPLDRVHRRLGARMDRMGGWWRPWEYDDVEAEYWAVRTGVSLCDVSTLGKMIVTGPDVVEFLERLYPCRVEDLAPGRSRYALLLAESGAVLDDGLIARIDDTAFALTFTSGGASFAEAWVRDWASGFDMDVRIMDRTHSLGAINVTGPHATDLVERAGLTEPLRFMRHGRATIGEVDCEVFRLSFTGEVSYELHHSVRDSERLWSRLIEIGRDLGIRPHGLHTLQTLRLEKGHIIVGVDTEPDSTPRRLGMSWAVAMDKDDFVGRPALTRTDRLPLDRRLVGLVVDGPAPIDGTPVYHHPDRSPHHPRRSPHHPRRSPHHPRRSPPHPRDSIAGYVTSATWSPILGQSVMLAWVDLLDGTVPDAVTVDGREARHAELPFYDPGGERARA